MWKTLLRYLIAWGFWNSIRTRFWQYTFVFIGFYLIYYINGQIEQYLSFTNNPDYLASLLIFKNLGYLFVIIVFVLWPFLFSSRDSKKTSAPASKKPDIARSSLSRNNDNLTEDDDGFNHIRSKDKIRSAADIEIEKSRQKNAK